MIDHALTMLRDELNGYIRSIPLHNDPTYVVLGNVSALSDTTNASLNNTILLTLVNIEEESTMKNHKPLPRLVNNIYQYDSAPVHLNLYVLFTANFPDDYNNGLIRLSQTIVCFQRKKVFELQNTISSAIIGVANDPADPHSELIQHLSLALDLYTMTFEQVNHLWGSLGGKQIPFVMYKVRLVALQELKVDRQAPPIESVVHDLHPVNEAC